MNKEQFKFSISNLINEYMTKVVALNVEVKGKTPDVVHMYSKQAEGLAQGFSEALNALIDTFAPDAINKEIEEEGNE